MSKSKNVTSISHDELRRAAEGLIERAKSPSRAAHKAWQQQSTATRQHLKLLDGGIPAMKAPGGKRPPRSILRGALPPKFGQMLRKKGSGVAHPMIVTGSSSPFPDIGVVKPPYDVDWTDAPYLPPTEPVPVPFPPDNTAMANRSTGTIYVTANTSPVNQDLVWIEDYAGMGFVYVPNRTGLLQVIANMTMASETGVDGSIWLQDNAGLVIDMSLGIAAYTRDMRQFKQYVSINTIELTDDEWSPSAGRPLPNNSPGPLGWLSYFTSVDTSSSYYCWLWFRVLARKWGGGSAAGYIRGSVDSFTYILL